MKKPIDSLILTLRGQKVLLDADLAELYGVPTKVFNQAIKRNSERFPEDFHFRLSAEETEALKCQFGTSRPAGADLKSQSVTATPESRYNGALKSQLATSKHGGRRTAPFAFTEHGAIMAATVLSSPEAVKMSVYVVRAFIQMREEIPVGITRQCGEVFPCLSGMERRQTRLPQHDARSVGRARKLPPDRRV